MIVQITIIFNTSPVCKEPSDCSVKIIIRDCLFVISSLKFESVCVSTIISYIILCECEYEYIPPNMHSWYAYV